MKSKLNKDQVAAVVALVKEISERPDVRIDVESFMEDRLLQKLSKELPELDLPEEELWDVYFRRDENDLWALHECSLDSAAASRLEEDGKKMGFQVKREPYEGTP